MPGNIAQFFTRHLARPARALYRHFVDDAWRDVTVAEVAALAGRWQAAFRREGLAPATASRCARATASTGSRSTSRRSGMGLVVVPLYVDDNADNVAWCVAQCRGAAARRRELAHCRGARETAPMPRTRCRRIVVLRPDDGETGGDCRRRFLPEAAGGTRGRGRCPTDTLATICFTSGTVRAAEGRDAVARQHHRQRRRNAGDRHGAARRRVPVDPAAVAHVRAHRRLLPAAVARRQGGVLRAASRRSPTISSSQAPTVDVRGAAHLRALPRRASTSRSRSRRRSSALFDACVDARLPRRDRQRAACSIALLVPPLRAARRQAGARAARRTPAPRGRRRRGARSGARAHVHRPRTSDAAGLRHDRGVAGDLGQPRRRQRARIRRTAAARRRGRLRRQAASCWRAAPT